MFPPTFAQMASMPFAPKISLFCAETLKAEKAVATALLQSKFVYFAL
ncbi:hypothetical protein C427_3580 [Paraglaciecola psychrophila 170]|uniref:Uncharacterized protein n=1 Tax=Paraglaciecola psychrophila 170 TaxID=1129794 RepID=M4RSP6_9ALTE|nr:hypothetical protein C427_3580 [Paraglaciecola psychrophila 170]